ARGRAEGRLGQHVGVRRSQDQQLAREARLIEAAARAVARSHGGVARSRIVDEHRSLHDAPAGAPPPDPAADVPTGELVGGILADTRELLAAHGDRLRRELLADVRGLRAVVNATVVAATAAMVAAVALAGAIAVTLRVLGLPAWAAAWIV